MKAPVFESPPECRLRFTVSGGGVAFDLPGGTFFVAVAVGAAGSLVIPYGQGENGSTLFLPMRASRYYRVSGGEVSAWQWDGLQWRASASDARIAGGRLSVPFPAKGAARWVAWEKAFAAPEDWGRLVATSDPFFDPLHEGYGDQALSLYWEDLRDGGGVELRHHGDAGRLRIYQLFVRLFANTATETRPNGTMAGNGCGKFEGITTAVLDSLRELGVTHLWLTGILQHATATEHPGLPADDRDLLKGIAGSPYAVRDPFDLCPDLATTAEARWPEFRALLARAHAAGLKVLIDLVPNHLARSTTSRLFPERSFGLEDDRSRFFDPQNHFFYLQPDGSGPPLRLPTAGQPGCDGLYEGERQWGRATGNNVASWQPQAHDWYETIKLNYGYDFTTGAACYPNAIEPEHPVPRTWEWLDDLIAHWQGEGVDGFRCDMAHLIPPEFWHWVIARARERQPEVVFVAEAYEDDPAAVRSRHPIVAMLPEPVTTALLDAGFDAVYEGQVRKLLKAMAEGKWANDLDALLEAPLTALRALRYAENHDEVRLAAAWGGMEIGRPVSAILFGLSQGPVLLYNGQELGEAAGEGSARGYGGGNARTSIFDYGVMPEVAKWANGGRWDGASLGPEQRALRAFYGRLLKVVGEPAFCSGICVALNGINTGNPQFGRVAGEVASGHWLYAFLRYEGRSGQCFLVVVNLHRSEAFRDVLLRLPEWLPMGWSAETKLQLLDRLAPSFPLRLVVTPGQLLLPLVPPLGTFYFEVTPFAQS